MIGILIYDGPGSRISIFVSVHKFVEMLFYTYQIYEIQTLTSRIE